MWTLTKNSHLSYKVIIFKSSNIQVDHSFSHTYHTETDFRILSYLDLCQPVSSMCLVLREVVTMLIAEVCREI